MRKLALFTIAGALALSACGKKPPEEPQTTNNLMEVPEDTIPNEMEAPAVVANNSMPAAPAPKISQDQQTLDDADATGLTARLPEAPVAVPTNQTGQTE